ncbi:MAG: 16S rRNA (cytosine(967)-C(5))-methyltransferase RsmB [Bulleidia sp.]|nr:16S rRNA (cytosine(967)-C(5))-methyltransferase RsmB [Bulleidia sp.]
MKPRQYACAAIERIVSEHGYASLILRNMPEEFSAQDRGLVSELVYGTVRNWTRCAFQWQDLARKKVKNRTAANLTMSVYQLLFLDKVPDYAVINEAVQQADRHEKGFVNAVLHAIQKRGEVKPVFKDDLEECAYETSHPLWLLKLWSAHYGKDNAMAIARHDQESALVYGRRNPLKLSMEELSSYKGIHLLEEDCFTCDGVLSRSPLFEQGKVLIQDRASQKIPQLLKAEPGMKVLDACAAPGTKTQQIACAMENQGEILAMDLHEERLALIDALMKRTGVSIVRTQAGDASKDNGLARNSFDRILVDAPCSGLGDLSHKPEIRFHVTPESLDELCSIQSGILETSSSLLKEGGILVYSTCTLNRKENEQQVRKFLERHAEFSLLEEHAWLPMELNSDGFYAAQLVKNRK